MKISTVKRCAAVVIVGLLSALPSGTLKTSDAGLGISLVVSLLFNYFQSHINQNLSTKLTASQLTVESLTAKNHALDIQVQGMVQAREAAQLAADKAQQEVEKLRRDAKVSVDEVRRAIQDEECYSRPLPRAVTERMHYY